MSLLNIFLWFELASLVIAGISQFRNRKSVMWWFIPLLILTNIFEWGNYFGIFVINGSNNWTCNLFVNPAEYLFFGFFFYSIILSGERKKIWITGAILFLFACFNLLFIQKIRYFNSYTYLLGCICIVYWVCLYFRYLMQGSWEENISTSPYFWVSVGCLLFFTGEFFLFSFFEYFLQINKFELFLDTYNIFSNLLNIIFYFCLSIAFLWTHKPKIS